MDDSTDYSILDSLAERCILLSESGTVLYANLTARQSAAGNPGLLSGLLPVAEQDRLQMQLAQSVETGQAISELYVLGSDTTQQFIKVTVQRYGGNLLLLCSDLSGYTDYLSGASGNVKQYHKAVLDNTPTGIVLIDANHKVLCFNREIQKDLNEYFGKDLYVGADYRDFVVESLHELYLWGVEQALNGETIDVETETSNGVITMWYHYRVNPVFDDKDQILGVSLSATNIDERKRREIALIEKEEEIKKQHDKILSDERYYRTLIETSSDAIVLLDEKGAVKYITPSTTVITGYTLAEMQSMDTSLLVHPEDLKADGANFEQFAATPGGTMRKRHRLLCKAGIYKWINASYRNLLSDPDVQAIVISYSDISEKVHFEEALKKSNRELALLNQINDIILRSRSEEALYNDVCACIIESGGYALAWIGMKPSAQNPDQSVLPIAASGHTSYLQEIRIAMDDPHLSNGPTGIVLKLGKTVVTNNVSNSANYLPWLEKASKHGIAASLVLPLHIDGAVMGALNIYATHTNAFDAAEVQILERLSANLSLAIGNLRTMIEKESAKYQLRERVKELTVIHQLHQLFQQTSSPLSTVLQQAVALLPAAWQYPEVCVAKIVLGTDIYFSKEHVAPANFQHAGFSIADGRQGLIEVGYTQTVSASSANAFLPEEQNLLNTVAETLEIFINKTVQKQALEQSEEYFRTSFEYAAVGKALTSIDGRFLKINRSFCSMLGFTREELMNLHIADVTYPDDVAGDTSYRQKMLQGSLEYYRTEKRYLHKNGTIIWGNLNTTLVRDTAGQPLYFVSQIENIDDKKKAQTALAHSEANMRSVFDNTDVGYLLLDNQFTVLSYNKSYVKGLATLAQMRMELNSNFLNMVPPAQIDMVRNFFRNVLDSQTPMDYEASVADGNRNRYFHFVAFPVTNNNVSIGLCVSVAEITARKNMELERQNMIEELLQKNRDLEQFAQILSHNIRGPLATLMGLNNFISDGMTMEDFAFVVDGMKTSAERLDTVIKDLNEILSLRRELTEAKETVDLPLLVAEVWRSIAQMVTESGATVHTRFSAAQSVVTVKSYMRHILFQLFSNSIRFRKPGTSPEITVSTETTEGKVIICVTDNGLGIDLPRFGNKLFQLYQRFHLQVPGKGLGLYLTKTMVEILHGAIEVESTPGSGTTFRISLPL